MLARELTPEKVYAADVDGGKFTVFHPELGERRFSLPEFISIDWLPHGHDILLEKGHFDEKKTATGQLLNADQRRLVVANLCARGSKLYLTQQKLTPKKNELLLQAGKYTILGKVEGEMSDAEVLWRALALYPGDSFIDATVGGKYWTIDGTVHREWRAAHLEDAKAICNAARIKSDDGKPYDHHPHAQFGYRVAQWAVDTGRLTPDLEVYIGISRATRGVSRANGHIKLSAVRITSLVTEMLDSSGERRRDPHGRPLGIRGVSDLFAKGPQKSGGITRSNLRHHTWRHVERKGVCREDFGKLERRWMQLIRDYHNEFGF